MYIYLPCEYCNIDGSEDNHRPGTCGNCGAPLKRAPERNGRRVDHVGDNRVLAVTYLDIYGEPMEWEEGIFTKEQT